MQEIPDHSSQKPLRQRVQLWYPELFLRKGGIQCFSAFFTKAVMRLLPESRIDVFVRNDKAVPHWLRLEARTQCHCCGQRWEWMSTVVFVAWVLISLFCKRPALIVVGHMNFVRLAFIVSKLFGVPYVVITHGVEAWGENGRRFSKSLRAAARIFAVSRYTRDNLIKETGVPPAHVVILPNTFDAERFMPGAKPAYLLKRHGLRRDQPVILTVARLASAERYKGYDQLLRILPAIRQAIPEVHYVLVGRGSDQARIETLVRDLGLADAITVTGSVSDTELPDYYNLCDVLAMPSKGEGFGIVYLEALASGNQVLAGNKDGSADIAKAISIDPNVPYYYADNGL